MRIIVLFIDFKDASEYVSSPKNIIKISTPPNITTVQGSNISKIHKYSEIHLEWP